MTVSLPLPINSNERVKAIREWQAKAIARAVERARHGERRACKRCGQDIEFHGSKHGWIDRGSDRFCQLVPDEIAGWVRSSRKLLHKPE